MNQQSCSDIGRWRLILIRMRAILEKMNGRKANENDIKKEKNQK